jgi:hypothetical protein
MGVTAGPADWWVATPQSFSGLITSCPAGTILPDGSALICKAGGTAWIVAPFCTQVGSSWNNSTTTLVGSKCCVCDWPTLCTQMISCGFTPADWFVPYAAQLQNPGFVCRTQWDTFSSASYWSSTEINATNACHVLFNGGGAVQQRNKADTCCVRAMRCVTY